MHEFRSTKKTLLAFIASIALKALKVRWENCTRDSGGQKRYG